MRFENYFFAPEIKKSISELGFKRPTDIQYKAIPSILNGEDVLAIAQTGTGKTAAFAIPVIQKLLEINKSEKQEHIQCLVMVPTHELAIQIGEVFKKIAQYTNLVTLSLYGGTEQAPQIAALNKGVDILIATPGRMFDLIKQGHLKITKVETLILDEADRMMDANFIKDIHDVIKFLHRKHQTLFFSATINEEIKDLAYSLVRNAIRIQISPKDKVSKNVSHAVAHIAMDDKRFFLERLIKENPEKKMIVFVRTQVRAERIAAAMIRVNINTVTIHGGKQQDDRGEAMQQFKEGQVKILIATDISARGIDLPNIAYVINYDLPEVAENYVHRVGRTGRGDQKGIAISFCSQEENSLLEEIEEFINQDVKVLDITKEQYFDVKDFSEDHSSDWKSLMKNDLKEQEALLSYKKKNNKPSKKAKKK